MTRKARIAWWNGEKFWGCTADVWHQGHVTPFRCSRRASHDPDADGNPTTCGVHCEAAKERRKAKSDASYAAYRSKMDWERRGRDLVADRLLII